MRFLRYTIPLIVILLLTGLPPQTSAARLVLLTGFPTLRQQHSLTCESSAVSMGTRGVISEGQLMANMPRNPNPNLGFRGNPNGEQGTTLIDYGVYAAPLQKALAKFSYGSDVITYGTDAMLKQYLSRGWPVVAWVTYQLQRATPRLAWFNGAQFFLVPHEHAVLIVGYDAHAVYANDPWVASMVAYRWRDFNRSWGLFANMALAIDPCPLAQPVQRITLDSATVAGLTWSWDRAKNAARYNVTVLLSKKGTVVYQATVTNQTVTIASPRPGGQYEIDVQAVSACGDTTQPLRQIVQLPKVLPGSTPTPGPEHTEVAPSPTPTATSSVIPSATSTPTLVP